MPAFKQVKESYFGEQTLKNVVNYVLRSGDVGGLAVDPERAVEQMALVKRLWNKENGRQVRHFILAFGTHEYLSPDEAMDYAYKIAAYYESRYQIVFGIHYDSMNLHIHFACNTVSCVDGAMYCGGYGDYHKLVNHIQSLMPQWRVMPVS